MTADEFRQWRSRMKLTINGAASLLGVKFSTARDYGQGQRRVPLYISNHCYLLEQKKLTEELMAKFKMGSAQAQEMAQMMATAYINAKRRRSSAIAMTLSSAVETEYMTEVLKELQANGFTLNAENKQAAG